LRLKSQFLLILVQALHVLGIERDGHGTRHPLE
jgi:hypothetical protein